MAPCLRRRSTPNFLSALRLSRSISKRSVRRNWYTWKNGRSSACTNSIQMPCLNWKDGPGTWRCFGASVLRHWMRYWRQKKSTSSKRRIMMTDDNQENMTAVPAMKLELVPVPVSDVDRARAFYVEKAGFKLEVDTRPTDTMRVVQ